MKKHLFMLIGAVCLNLAAHAQEAEDGWIYRVSQIVTDDCIDSTKCYTAIKVDLNLSVVPDSAEIWMKIGEEVGSDSLFSKRFLNTEALSSYEEYSIDSLENISLNLGKFIIGENFFVDMEIVEEIGEYTEIIGKAKGPEGIVKRKFEPIEDKPVKERKENVEVNKEKLVKERKDDAGVKEEKTKSLKEKNE